MGIEFPKMSHGARHLRKVFLEMLIETVTAQLFPASPVKAAPNRMKTNLLQLACLIVASQLHAANWPSFRGENGDASSDDKAVPLKWSATENMKWKLALPGAGAAGPIV